MIAKTRISPDTKAALKSYDKHLLEVSQKAIEKLVDELLYKSDKSNYRGLCRTLTARIQAYKRLLEKYYRLRRDA
jgi:hypothetical protein